MNIFKNYQLKNYRFRLVIYVVVLSVIGILVIGSAKESVQGRQIMGLILGLVFMTAFSLIDYKQLLKLRYIAYLLAIALLTAVLLMGQSANNATRWFEIGGIRFQPSELCKILLIVFFAGYLMRHEQNINTLRILLYFIAMCAIPLFLIAAEPDLSTTIITTLILITILFIAGLSYKIILAILALGIPLSIVGLMLIIKQKLPFIKEYQYNRVLSFIDPAHHSDGANQQVNAAIAIGSGQLWGKGLNNNSIASLKNANFILEPQTDFIFTVIGEELGFIGCIIVIVLFVLIVLECIYIAFRARDLAGKLIASGMAALIGFQAFVNIGVNTSVLPNTGLPLPFVSYGLTSLISLFIGIGLVLNVGLQTNKA